MREHLDRPLHAPVATVLAYVEWTLRRHGFVACEPLDLQAALRDRVGAHLPPFVVLFVFNPATTHRVLRHDKAAAARTIVQVVIRETADGVVVQVTDPGQPVEPAIEDILRDMRRRLSADLGRIPAVLGPAAEAGRSRPPDA